MSKPEQTASGQPASRFKGVVGLAVNTLGLAAWILLAAIAVAYIQDPQRDYTAAAVWAALTIGFVAGLWYDRRRERRERRQADRSAADTQEQTP